MRSILFVGPLILLIWISDSGWIIHLLASLLVRSRILRFTSGATPAGLLTASMSETSYTCMKLKCVRIWGIFTRNSNHGLGGCPVNSGSQMTTLLKNRTLKDNMVNLSMI